jgi:hypothetical protein
MTVLAVDLVQRHNWLKTFIFSEENLQFFLKIRHVSLGARFIDSENYKKILYTSPWAGGYAMGVFGGFFSFFRENFLFFDFYLFFAPYLWLGKNGV